ncbi:uncharacterized protein LOC102220450 [Xiphophorus maculatus]|uniref:uncharacterized protein LOC102220450 n=1 Tax=Xiphophorus maculatus TaxID=8083 RepID=UPI000C6EBA5C|nr:uncharacterized protein LOC102220450 [Xiphophorus maculatus]
MLLTVIFLSLLASAGFSVTVLQSADQIASSDADATLECSVGAGFSMSSYTMLWYRQNRQGAEIQLLLAEYETTAGRYRSSLEAEKNKFSLSIPELKVNDSSIYYCAARHSDARGPNTRTNTRLAATEAGRSCGSTRLVSCIRTIDQPPSLLPEVGQQAVNLKCEQDDEQYLNMYWYRQISSISSMELVAYSLGKDISTIEAPFQDTKYSMSRPSTLSTTLQINKAEPGDSAVYYCASILCSDSYPAYFGEGTKLTVLEDGAKVTEPNVKILPPSPHECRDQKKEKGERRKTLVCLASGFYPDHVSVFWQLNGQNVTDGVATDAAAKKNETTKMYSITSRLRLRAKTWFNPGNEFSCHITFFNGTNYKIYTAPIYTNETDTGMTREKYLRITQNAKLSYSALIVKSCLYAALVCFLVWRLQSSPKKRKQ